MYSILTARAVEIIILWVQRGENIWRKTSQRIRKK